MGGEAPERPDYFRGGSDRCPRLDVATPIDSPSRGLTLDHRSARVSSEQNVLARENLQRCVAVPLFGSLAPPSDERELIPTVVSLLTPAWRALLAVPERCFEEPGMALTKSPQEPAR